MSSSSICKRILCIDCSVLTVRASFIFTLQEFAEELISLVDAMERIYSFERRRLLQGSALSRLGTSIARQVALIQLWFKGVDQDEPRTAGLTRTLSEYISFMDQLTMLNSSGFRLHRTATQIWSFFLSPSTTPCTRYRADAFEVAADSVG